MAEIRVRKAPFIGEEYGIREGQIKTAYARSAGRKMANPYPYGDGSAWVWVESDVPGERVKLLRGEYEWHDA